MPRYTWPAVRAKLLFFGGMGGFVFELVFRRPPDFVMLPVIAAMLGLESFLRGDEKASGGATDGNSHDNSAPGG